MLAAKLLKNAREESGLSLRALARRAGTSHATLLAYENGKKVPGVDTLERIARAAGFAVDLNLSRRIRGNAEYSRGEELTDALELAAQFPSKHSRKMVYPAFARRVK